MIGFCSVFAGHARAQTFRTLYNFSALHSLTNHDGANPSGSLILSGNTLYGTSGFGRSSGSGTVFALNTDGTGFANLHSFGKATSYDYLGNPINSGGIIPFAGLVL